MNEEHTPVVEPITNAQSALDPKPDWKHHFTTVTPLSRALAMLLFIALPFVGFLVGTKYGEPTQNALITVESPVDQTKKSVDGAEIMWRYSTTAEIPESWQTLEDADMGFSIAIPNQYAFSKWEQDSYGASEIAGGYTVCDTLLPLKPNPYPDPNEIKTACTGFQTILTISLRNNAVTQQEIDSWGGEAYNESQTKVNGREVWTVGYLNAIDFGVYKFINNPSNNTAVGIDFTVSGFGRPSRTESHSLAPLGQQILDTLTVNSENVRKNDVTTNQDSISVSETSTPTQGDQQVKVISPNGGEVFTSGESYVISWATIPALQDAKNWSVEVRYHGELRGDARVVYGPAVDIGNSYTWLVPTLGAYPIGETYRIEVCLLSPNMESSNESFHRICDSSDSRITIAPPK